MQHTAAIHTALVTLPIVSELHEVTMSVGLQGSASTA